MGRWGRHRRMRKYLRGASQGGCAWNRSWWFRDMRSLGGRDRGSGLRELGLLRVHPDHPANKDYDNEYDPDCRRLRGIHLKKLTKKDLLSEGCGGQGRIKPSSILTGTLKRRRITEGLNTQLSSANCWPWAFAGDVLKSGCSVKMIWS